PRPPPCRVVRDSVCSLHKRRPGGELPALRTSGGLDETESRTPWAAARRTHGRHGQGNRVSCTRLTGVRLSTPRVRARRGAPRGRNDQVVFDVLTRADLIRDGFSSRAITAAVKSGDLVRARQDRYLARDAPPPLVDAVRVGGRLGCLSLLALLGVFVFDGSTLHVHMERGDSRMRSRLSRRRRLPDRGKRGPMLLHWRRLTDEPGLGAVGVIDALISAVRCQEPRHAIATLDSALNLGVIDDVGFAEVFARLPARFQLLRGFVDARAQAGTETLVRLMAQRLGCHVVLQVVFEGVGRVDLVLDGWLVVECDSRAFHGTWEQRLKDYRRDRALAAKGLCVLRLAAEDILYRPESVVESLRGLIHSRRQL
ncbi:hypothetical protein ABFC64_12840, partial [Microbacterium rhizosphaerae]